MATGNMCAAVCGYVLWQEKNKYLSDLRNAAIKDELTRGKQLKI